MTNTQAPAQPPTLADGGVDASPPTVTSAAPDPVAAFDFSAVVAEKLPDPAAKYKPKGRVAPTYKEKMTLPPELEALNMGQRPMIWRDLADFAAGHKRTIADMVYDFVLLTNHAYSRKTPLRTIVPFDLELLTRIYEEFPSSCAWVRPSIQNSFELMYGEHLGIFDPEYEPAARLAVGRRYAKMLGRVDTAQYRWLSDEGKITRRISNILSKVETCASENESARQIFERISTRVWALRGYDIEQHFPMPTLKSVLKQPGTRGRMLSSSKAPRSSVPTIYEGGAFE